MSLCHVGIVGATGFAGGELIRILLRHPKVRLHFLGSRSDARTRVDDFYPHLRGQTDLCFEDLDVEKMAGCDVVFFATPNGTAMQYAPALLTLGIKVIDLSADFRLKSVESWEKWYDMPHACPQWIESAVYGLPEIHRDAIQTAQLIACPGCYPTAVQLALLPAVSAGLVEMDSIIADVKSGVSGAGRQAKPHLMMTERVENFAPYAILGHRHQPEIEQGFSLAAKTPASVTFIPHLLPIARGIEATVYATLKQSDIDLNALYQNFYQTAPFVDILPHGMAPATRDVRGTNFCRLSFCQPAASNRLVVFSVIDNLVKGAAGQAVQCMNIMQQWPETTGLSNLAVVP